MRIFLLFILCFSVNLLYAQDYIEQMEDPDANFYDIQKSFNKYWLGKKIERGNGWKQFKRWEYFMESRVYPTGRLPEPDFVSREYKKYLKQYPKSTHKKSNADWTPKGPGSWNTTSYNPGLGRVNCVTVAPNDANIICIGAPSGGFWKSVDGGLTWYTTTDSLTVLGVSAIAIDPTNSDIIYIATGDGDGGATYSIGVLYSTDGGYTWNTTGLNWQITQSRRISKLLIHPINPDILIAATNNGIYKTNNAGVTWNLIQSGNFKDMEFKPGDPSTIYACGSSYYKSTDTGNSFNQVTSGVPASYSVNRLAIAVTPANPDYVYMLAGSSSNSGFYGLYRSTNSGTSFSTMSTTPNILGYSSNGTSTGGQSSYDLAIAVSPNNADEIYTGGINIWRSNDGGTTWSINAYWYYPEPAYPYVHADCHSLDFYGPILYSGCDGGIFKTSNGGSTWEDISAGLYITQFYRIGGFPGNSELIIGGTQDNGTNRFNTGQWTHVLGADGMEAAIDYSNPSTMYAAIQYGGLRRSYDGGDSFSSIENNINENGGWVTPYVLDPIDPNTIYAGFVNVWKSTNQGDFWTKISSFGGTLRSLAISQSNPDYIYAATSSSIRRTTNGGVSWTNINAGLPTSASITYITISDIDPEKIWVTFSGFSNGNKVFTSTTGGDTWTNISGSLPNIPVNCIVHQSNSNDGIYIGTDLGIYYKNNNSNDWELFSNNLPNVIVRELEIHYASGLIRAATYGRGLWESPLALHGALIAHTPFEDTEDITGPYEIVAQINQGSSPLVLDSLKAYYSTNNSFANYSPFSPTAIPDEYVAFIPSQGSDIFINYYISVNDSAGIKMTSPINAPTMYYSFFVGPDTIPPTIIHNPLTSANLIDLPLMIEAKVIDNIGINRVWVEYTKNNLPQMSFDLSAGDSSTFSNYFPFDSTDISIGDTIVYRIIAQDSSSNMNLEATGYFLFVLEHILTYTSNPNLFIPTNNTTGISDTLVVSGYNNIRIIDLDLFFKASHPNFGDFIIKLISPDNSEIILIDRPGYPGLTFGNQGNNPDIILDDEALESIEDVTFGNSDNVIGTFIPFPDSLKTFNGQGINGRWIIQVTDNFPPFAGTFTEWGLKFSVDQITSIVIKNNSEIPEKFALYQNFPNPFNPFTTIRYNLPASTKVKISIFSVLGQEVKTLVNSYQTRGSKSVIWNGIDKNGRAASTGVYFYRIQSEQFNDTKKLLLIK